MMPIAYSAVASWNVTRRHRFIALALALFAAGMFFLFVSHGFLSDDPPLRFRECGSSPIYNDLSFSDLRSKYHYTMEQLLEERMQLYEGTTLLQCNSETMDEIIPEGTLAADVAESLHDVPDPPMFKYRHFELMLHEFWRTYDCHLFSLSTHDIVGQNIVFDAKKPSEYTDFMGVQSAVLYRERIRARITFDRVVQVIRSSEAYLPLHASLRCLQRGASDVRNTTAILSDVAQCIPERLGQPETSLRR